MLNRRRQFTVVLAALAVSGAAASFALFFWFKAAPPVPVEMRLPGADGAPAESAMRTDTVDLAGTFRKFDGTPSTLSGEWPCFRGPDRDNICKNSPPLLDSWGNTGASILWKIDLGEGHAGAAVSNGRVYVLDYDEALRADSIRCFSLEDGREIWRRSYKVSVKRNHGMSRTVPAVDGKYVVTLGPRCHVVCLDAVSGDFRWGIDLQRQYGATEPLWYAGQCPLIEDGRVMIAPAGKDVLMMALDCETGNVIWDTPNANGWQMSHSSIIPTTIAGKRMYIYCAVGGVTGVSAEPADAGKVLWELPWAAKVVAPSPVPLEEDMANRSRKIFLTAGYGEGGMMIEVSESSGSFNAEALYKHGPKDGLACEQQTPIYFNGLLYGLMPKDAGALRSQFVCYNADGSLAWSSGQDNRFGLGPFIMADGKLYILNDNGMLTVARISREKFEPLGQAQVLQGQDAWGPAAIAGGRMLVRDDKEMVCLDMRAKP